LSPDERREELRRSRAVLEEGLGEPVEHLAYPYGGTSAEVRRDVQAAGYRSAVTLATGRWRAATDPLDIPRQDLDLIAVRTPRTARLSIEAGARGTFGWYTAAKARVRRLYATPAHRRTSGR
jgi:peptidoglycan/xylan/chitin deacetylase (PgdA/CDA1 family)